MSEPMRPQIVTPTEGEDQGQQVVAHPAKLLRIASMIREIVEEVRQTSLDEKGRTRLAEVYRSSVRELREALSEDLQRELDELAAPLESSESESEIRIAQAQLLGWLEGLFHGIQAALWAQHAQAQAALEEMRRRQLPSGRGGRRPGPPEPTEPQGPAGQYL
ncbi:MAG TPA: proteasome activator [Actinomycetota bacterium]|nr:proteasome activator [Actinomycetota bacterium]